MLAVVTKTFFDILNALFVQTSIVIVAKRSAVSPISFLVAGGGVETSLLQVEFFSFKEIFVSRSSPVKRFVCVCNPYQPCQLL